jgi:hypothetical protein
MQPKGGLYKNLNVPVVLYGCEKWSLILSEERSLRVFENTVLTRLFEPKSDKETGEWSKLHNEELNDLTCSPYIFRGITTRII